MAESSQKFLSRNRPPRVQIEYDVETYGSEKAVQLPFVMGVMADLSGDSASELPAVGERKFLETDVDNFDERLKSMKPTAKFRVNNTLTGEGELGIDLEFESMEDFSPGRIAEKVEPLQKLLESRRRLVQLATYMDGKAGAEELMAKLMADPALIKELAEKPLAVSDDAGADSEAA